jgi:hypothetical protein
MKEMATYFRMRPGFEKFHLEPEANKNLLIGERDRRHRNIVFDALEEACYGREGHKTVIFGDYGRGKTHEAHNIMWLAEKRGLPLLPVYAACHEFKAKEPFSTLFGMLVGNIGVDRVRNVASQYKNRVNDGNAAPIREIVGSDDIANAWEALHNPSVSTVRAAMRWLGGSDEVKPSSFSDDVTGYLSVSRQFAAVMKGFAHMFRVVDDKVLAFFIDETERFQLVSHTDTYWSWIGCLRALTELPNIGFVFYVGARTRDFIPNMLTYDEVVTRIGGQNYRELLEPSLDELRQWIVELFQTLIRKGPLPKEHVDALPAAARIDEVDPEIATLVGSDASALRTYPFMPDALEEFVTQCTTQELANRPREVLKRIQSAARRAMRLDRTRIDLDILKEIHTESF